MTPRYTKFILGLVMIIGSVLGAYPRNVFAGNYFGGMETSTFTCNCSGGTLFYINNYANGGGVLALVYNGSGRIFSNNNIYGRYLLGSYTPGGTCTYHVAQTCPSMKSDGSFDSNPGTGTS